VARRTLANHHRGAGRRGRLGQRLREQLATCVPDPAERVVDQLAVENALATLGSAEREVMQLALWEGLEPREIAVVLRTTSLAVRSRLSRARAKLRDQLGNDFPTPGHDSTRQPTPAREEDR
jgi:RNA polymerase sigma factor (sigma-70 family)